MSGYEPIGDHYENMEKIKPLRLYPEYYENGFSGRLNLDKPAVSEEEAGPSPRAFKYFKFVFYRDNNRLKRAGCPNVIGHVQGEHPQDDASERQFRDLYGRFFSGAFKTKAYLYGTLNFYDKNGDMVLEKHLMFQVVEETFLTMHLM